MLETTNNMIQEEEETPELPNGSLMVNLATAIQLIDTTWSVKQEKIFMKNEPYIDVGIIYHQQDGYCLLPRSKRHGRKRSYTEKYDDLHGPVLRPFISVSSTEKYGDIRRKKRSFTSVYGFRNCRPGL
jgi:hypothetical protein